MSDCIFCKIVDGTIPAKIVTQDDRAVAFRDSNPQAPTHVLVIPKKHIASLNELDDADAALVGHLHVVAKKIALDEGLADGWRTVFNTGKHAGQTVFHIHLHVLGGRALGWPPG
ncbi:MAG TPA: histidine triad nucleotide-binding protein [Polyangia bacterium]|jgi:histidine triad (HIT) family protein